MELELFQVSAFTQDPFAGNPACVIPLQKWLPDDLLLKIARENAVAETAFYMEEGPGFKLRWFTPEMEMDLCGHATLATAHVIKNIKKFSGRNIIFDTRSGKIIVSFKDSRYLLDLPNRDPTPHGMPLLLKDSLNLQPVEILKARDFVLVFPSENSIKEIQINRIYFDRLELGTGGVIVTAPGDECDFVSRFFTPGASVFEDPVTGSAHCSLIPYWSKKLGRSKMKARQLSERGGELFCTLKEDRIEVAGHAVTYFAGSLLLDSI